MVWCRTRVGRPLGWVLFAVIAVACLSLTTLTVRSRRSGPPPPQLPLEPMSLQGFRTALSQEGQLRLRVSGDSATVSHTKLFGPFSLGFAYALVARNVVIDTYPMADDSLTQAASPPDHVPPEFSTLAASLAAVPRVLARQRIPMNVTRAELGPVKIVAHRDGEDRVLLTATACRASLPSSGIACTNGVIDREGNATPFRKLTYDCETRTVRTAQ